MKIYINPKDYSNDDMYQFMRCVPTLNDFGIVHTNNICASDIYITTTARTHENINNLHHNICVIGTYDASSVFSRNKLISKNVSYWIPRSTTKTVQQQNCHIQRYHSYLLGNDHYDNTIDITQEDFNKIYVGCNLSHWSRMKYWTNDLPEIIKDIDVLCIGHTTYDDAYITQHRQTFYNIVNQLSYSYHTPRVNQREYNKLVQRAKVIVSPWGYGELCYRDAEAMFGQAILIKPNSSHVITWPNMFSNNKTYIPCDIHGRDLINKIEYALDHWKSLQSMLIHNRTMLVNSWQINNMTQHFANILLKRKTHNVK